MSDDSDADIKQELQNIIEANIVHLETLKSSIEKLNDNQLTEANKICKNNYNSLDEFIQSIGGSPIDKKKKKTKAQQANGKKAADESNKKKKPSTKFKESKKKSKLQDNDEFFLNDSD